MLKLYSGIDILTDAGSIQSRKAAERLLEASLDEQNLKKIHHLDNEEVILKLANAVALCRPESVFIHSGSAADMQFVRSMAVRNGEEFPLAAPGHTCHFDLPEDQGRMVDQTFYIVNDGEELSVLSRRIERGAAREYVNQQMRGIMAGKTMIVGMYSRGPVGSRAAVPALQISDSFYVIHSADMLYATAFQEMTKEVKRAGMFFTNLHSMGSFSSSDISKARIFMDRSWLTTFSMHCTYAGNTLMLKKGNHRFAIDRATYAGKGKELSEHMFITGLTGPGGRKTFFAGAAPSGCGKTTTAMVGTDLIGDDLAQLWIADDGSLRAINPEIGVFGIVQDVNRDGDPILMESLERSSAEVIWSNLLIAEDDHPRWVGDGGALPLHGRNWLGRWSPDSKDGRGRPIPMSHPNARFTMRSDSVTNYNHDLATSPAGVPVSVITYSGRDSDTMPPVWVAKDADAGVAIGASIFSVATATEVGASGVKRQPWANAAFIPGPLAHYMKAQFDFFNSEQLKPKPVIAGLNYFLNHAARGGDSLELLGEKRDVLVWLSWLERYAHGEMTAIETPIGFIPTYRDLKVLFVQLISKEYPRDLYERQFSIYVDKILYRIVILEESYKEEVDVPGRIFDVYAEQRRLLLRLKEQYGPIVAPLEMAEYARI